MTTIVFCEDNASIRKLISVAMRSTDHRVLIAADGREGLDLIRAEMPALIVTDLAMPVMDGIELYDALQREPELAAIPVVFLTASTQRGLITAARERRPTAIINKPFSPSQLREELETLLVAKVELP
jgi:CheY-like chemotaxis protein